MKKVFRKLLATVFMIPVCISAWLMIGFAWIITWLCMQDEERKRIAVTLREFYPSYVFRQVWGQK